MWFQGRELKPYAEPVTRAELVEGHEYFSVQFVDEALLIPVIETWVFVGENLEEGDEDTLYFQDVESFREGKRYVEGGAFGTGQFQTCSAKKPDHIFTFEHALDLLMACSLRRRAKARDG